VRVHGVLHVCVRVRVCHGCLNMPCRHARLEDMSVSHTLMRRLSLGNAIHGAQQFEENQKRPHDGKQSVFFDVHACTLAFAGRFKASGPPCTCALLPRQGTRAGACKTAMGTDGEIQCHPH